MVFSVVVAGGQDNISSVQGPYFEWAQRQQDEYGGRRSGTCLHADVADCRNMLPPNTESLESKWTRMDRESQQKVAKAQQAGLFDG